MLIISRRYSRPVVSAATDQHYIINISTKQAPSNVRNRSSSTATPLNQHYQLLRRAVSLYSLYFISAFRRVIIMHHLTLCTSFTILS